MEENRRLGKLTGKIAVITGGAAGIGAAAAHRFAQEGADIVVADINIPNGQQLVDKLCTEGTKAMFIKTDVTQKEEVVALLSQTYETFGGIDILVSNAGCLGPMGAVADHPLDGWNQVINLDLHGSYYLCRYGLPYLLKRGGGSIVINASLTAYEAAAQTPDYAATKAALCGLTQSLAYDFGHRNIRVNSVCPAAVDTSLFRESISRMNFTPEEEKADAERRLGEYPLGRLGRPEDVADLMLFLASDESAYITGKNIIIDGGYWAGIPRF